MFPEYWKKYLPEHIHKWIGRPLLLLKALYGYNYSGKFLYQDQAEFLVEQGMVQIMPGFWIKHLPNDKIHMFLHYVDDILSASNDDQYHNDFIVCLQARFEAEV